MHQQGNTREGNSVVRLSSVSRSGPEPTRIGAKNVANMKSEPLVRGFSIPSTAPRVSPAARRAIDMQARAVVAPRPRVAPDVRGLGRIIDAIEAGEDTRIAAQKPASLISRIFAFLLLPALLISPVAAAASEEAPIAIQVGAAVAEMADAPVPEVPAVLPDAPQPVGAPGNVDASSANAVSPSESTESTVAPSEALVVASSTENVEPLAPVVGPTLASDPVTAPEPVSSSTPPIAVPAQGESSAPSGGGAENVPASEVAPSTPVVNPDSPVTLPGVAVVQEALLKETPSASSSILDIAPPEQLETIEDIRAQLRAELKGEVMNEVRNELRDSVRDEVRMEVVRDVERKMEHRCTKIPDGSGVYCVNSLDLFGAKSVSNESVSVQSAPNAISKNKEIFITRDGITTQLTHSADDNISPSLDPVGSLVVWQSAQGSHAQISWANTREAKPVVHMLTSGENNFYPKVYAGRVVWQAWIEGNWEIVFAEPAVTQLRDDELSPENRALGVDGNWIVHRITHNSVPDMFPTLTRDTISWQAVDGSVWQVFSYDLVNGKTYRVSRAGVSSESPSSAMVWTERSGDSVRLVGRELDGSRMIDFTDAARRASEHDLPPPVAPVDSTQLIATGSSTRPETSTDTEVVE